MQLPISVLDFDMNSGCDIVVPHGTKIAKVLVRWGRVPIGSIDIPVIGDILFCHHIIKHVQTSLYYELEKELVRRSLICGTKGSPISLSDHWAANDVPDTKSTISLTIIVCTRDRPLDLMRCLNSILALTLAPHEVLVVDSASTNNATERVVKDYFPSFRYIREERAGLDFARNRGIRESSSDIVAFTDDDVVVDSLWTTALVHEFSSDDSLGLVTGLIIPDEQETEAQVWFERYGGFGRGYAKSYLRMNPGSAMHWSAIGAGQLGAGANMAIRRTAFKDVGLFDPALDVGTSTLGGGDHEMFFRLLKSGWGCLYDPNALVRHRHRRSMIELKRLLYNYGYATRCFFERVAQEFPEDRASVGQLSRWWWVHWGACRLLKSSITGGSFPAQLIWAEVKGYYNGKNGYNRSRSEINIDESLRPDVFSNPFNISNHLKKVGIVEVDIESPLSDLDESANFEELEVVVFSNRLPLGSVRLKCFGSKISRFRLADAISTLLSGNILASSCQNLNLGWSIFYTSLCSILEVRTPQQASSINFSVSIIVTTCNRPDSLRRCLDSLVTIQHFGELEIIVVDNRPDSGVASLVIKNFPGVRLVREDRRGSSFARNAGILASRGDIIAMIDDDMKVSSEWLRQLTKPFERADVFAVTGNTLAGSLETSAELAFEQYGGFCRGMNSKEYSYNWLYGPWRAAATWEIGGSGNAAFRSSIFRDSKIGYFTEILGAGVPAGVGEDTLMFYQILRAGGTICYKPGAIAWHYHRASNSELRRQLLAYSKGHVAYHLVTLIKYNDLRGLSRILFELPKSLASRCLARSIRRNNYPWTLLAIEIAGTLLGPISLIQSYFHVCKEKKKICRHLPEDERSYQKEESNFEPNS
jgi:GT2 family glycosyltransferase